MLKYLNVPRIICVGIGYARVANLAQIFEQLQADLLRRWEFMI